MFLFITSMCVCVCVCMHAYNVLCVCVHAYMYMRACVVVYVFANKAISDNNLALKSPSCYLFIFLVVFFDSCL